MNSSTAPKHFPGTPTPERRFFFRWLTYLTGAIATAFIGIPFVAYLLRIRPTPKDWVDLGPISSFPEGETRLHTFENPIRQPWDGMTANTGVFVRNQGESAGPKEQFRILAVNCAHLGCPVTWFPQSGLFMCPCHGGVYYSSGEHASGPPPRGLYHCVWKIDKDNLFVQAPHFPTLQNTLTGRTS